MNADRQRCGAASRQGDAISSEHFFIPERFTALYHTAVYDCLTSEQALYYNQMTGMYFNEHFIFFETMLSDHFLSPIVEHLADGEAKNQVLTFMDEEIEHSRMFAELNRELAPSWYGGNLFFFIQVPAVPLAILRFVGKRPERFPFLIWLGMMQEERAIFYANQFVLEAADLEPRFVDVHRRHLADEEDHLDHELLLQELYWEPAGRFTQRYNAWICSWLIFEYFTAPRRGGIRLFDQLITRYPELKKHRKTVIDAYATLNRSSEYMARHYGPDAISRTLTRARAYRALAPLVKRIELLWSPQPVAP